MLKEVNKKRKALKMQWRDQFAEFKKEIRTNRDKRFPKKNMELPIPKWEIKANKRDESVFSPRNIIYFWIAGLVVAAIGFFLYNTLSYVFMLVAAFIISLAIEGVISFRHRLTRSRGL